jgi:hypothetical protein
MPVAFSANFLLFFQRLAHILKEIRLEVVSKSVTSTGRKVPFVRRSLGKMNSMAGRERTLYYIP